MKQKDNIIDSKQKEIIDLKSQIDNLNKEKQLSQLQTTQQYNNLSEELKKEKNEKAKLIEEKDNIQQLLENEMQADKNKIIIFQKDNDILKNEKLKKEEEINSLKSEKSQREKKLKN